MPTQNKYALWRTLIAENRFDTVLNSLKNAMAGSPRLSAVLQETGRYAALKARIIGGTLSPETETLTGNQIRSSLLALLDDLEERENADPILAEEMADINITGDVRNAVIGSTIAAEKLHIGDIYYGSEPIPHFLTESPQVLPVFKGRDDELTKLHNQLFDGEGDHLILLVNGQGGVGKTSIATQYFFNYHHEYSHAAWVLKKGNIRDTMLDLEFGLNLKFSTETNEQRLSTILQKVANLKAPCLLIIDNANERDDLKQHIGILRQCANFHVLLTSRLNSFDGAETYKVGPLPEPVARELFEQYYRPFNEEEDALFPDVYNAVDGNTLVLQLLAKNLKRNRRKYQLTELLADLQERGVLHLNQTKKVVTNYGSLSEGQIEDIVAAMYDLGDLSDDQLKLLSVFAALPPEKILFDHLEVLVTFLDDLEETLDELQELGWVEESESSYRCSPVVQAVVRNKNGEWRKVLPFLRSKIANKLASDQSGNLKIGIKAARPFVAYGEAIAPFLPREEQNLFFYQQLMFFYGSSGNLRTSMNWGQKLVSLSKDLLKDNPDNVGFKNGLAISYEKLGKTHSSLGNLTKALQFFEERSRLGLELHRDFLDNVGFKNGLAISYEKLGKTHASLGQLTKALQFFDLDIELSKELHRDFPDNVEFKNGLAISYSQLGDTHASLGQLPKALESFEERSRLGLELHRDFPDSVGFKNGLAVSYEKLGKTHSSLGQLPKALQFFEIGTNLFEELHRDFPDNVEFKNGLAISYSQLGTTHSSLKNLTKALQFFDLDIELSKELHQDFPNNVGFKNRLAISYSQLGDTHASLGQRPKALQFFEMETNLFEKLHRDFPDNVGFKNDLAISYSQLGDTHASLGQLPKALQFFEIGTNSFEELHRDFPDNVGFKNGLAISYVKLGEMAQEAAEKQAHYRKAEQLWVELTDAFPEYAQFQSFLGIIREQLAKF